MFVKPFFTFIEKNIMKFDYQLFKAAKAVAYTLVFVLALVSISSLFSLIKSDDSTIEIEDLIQSDELDNVSNEETIIILSDETIEKVGRDNLETINNWVKDLTYSQRIDFIENLEDIVDDSENYDYEISDLLNTYRTIKRKKIVVSEMAEIKENLSRGFNLIVLFSSLTMISLFISTIVLINIEKNTRAQN